MDQNLVALIGLAAIGVFLGLVIFVLPKRKLPEEKGLKLLYEEHCSANWKLAGGVLTAGGSIPIARVSFYKDFFVISMVTISKISYTEIESSSVKNNFLARSITINFNDGKSLVINSNNGAKIQSIVAIRNPKAV